ncbi:Uncharacterised protein [uncultured archaeon]|nr:Uncharacterised protein [uncultured archaeon]
MKMSHWTNLWVDFIRNKSCKRISKQQNITVDRYWQTTRSMTRWPTILANRGRSSP